MDNKLLKSVQGVRYAQEAILQFNDSSHLLNHLNYLFRSDKNQKWTNKNTPNCSFSLYTPTGWVTKPFSDDRNVRDNCKQAIYDWAVHRWSQDTFKHLAMGVSYFYDLNNNLVHINNESIFDLTRLFAEETFSEFEDLFPFLNVCHADQGEAIHIHRLYLRNV